MNELTLREIRLKLGMTMDEMAVAVCERGGNG